MFADPCFVDFLMAFSSHEYLHNSYFAILTGQVEICSLKGTFRNGSFVCDELSPFCYTKVIDSSKFEFVYFCANRFPFSIY